MSRTKAVSRCVLAVIMIGAGTMHFVNPDFYIRIMPPYLPLHTELVYLSGVFEIVLGVLILIPRYSTLAAWGMIALLIAVFPANLHMALNPELFSDVSPAALYIRLPIQIGFIAWSYWATRP